MFNTKQIDYSYVETLKLLLDMHEKLGLIIVLLLLFGEYACVPNILTFVMNVCQAVYTRAQIVRDAIFKRR